MKEPTPRELTLGILLEVNEKKAYSHIALRSVLEKYAYLGPEKRGMIRRLSIGTLEKQIQLDYILDGYSKVKTAKMKPVIRNILRMAVYEMLYMDAIPVSASCNEAVKLAEKKGFRNLKGFVNGVLRAVARNMEGMTLPDRLSIRYAMPEWIVRRWTEDYGREKTEEILKGFDGEPPLTVHGVEASMTEDTLLSLWEDEGVAFIGAEIPHAFHIRIPDRLTHLSSFQKGGFFVQDLSSMKALSVLPLFPGMKILDICGAPGGKTMFLSDALLRMKKEEQGARCRSNLLADGITGSGPYGLSQIPTVVVRGERASTGEMDAASAITCRDLTEEKVIRVLENISRCKLPFCRAEVHDALSFDPEWEEKADAVIADLPCSGLGVLGRKPDIKLRQSEEDCCALSALQQRILSVSHRYVKPGGYLLYSTCTISRIENEENADWFLREYSDFSLAGREQLFPIAGVQDGFFYALFRKR